MLISLFANLTLISTKVFSTPTQGLTIRTFPNSALSLPSYSTSVANTTTSISIPDISTTQQTLSSIVSGTITFPSLGLYSFQCQILHTSMRFMWIDGHLLCQDGHVYNITHSSTDNPLPIRRRKTFPFRAHVYKNTSIQELMSLSVTWSSSNNSFTAIPSTALTTELSLNEQKRDTVQRKASIGWGNMLHSNMLTFTKLPAGLAITI